MAAKSQNAEWLEFERDVSDAYRALGARNVQHDVNLNGHQIDVYAEIPVVDGTFLRSIVSCKCYAGVAGIDDVKEVSHVFDTLRASRTVDHATIVSKRGFSRPAKQLAVTLGIRLLELADLVRSQIDLTPYRDDVINAFQAEPLFRDDFYIPLRLRDESCQVVPSIESLEKFMATPEPHLLAILGDYGTGKTTLSKYLYLQLALQHKKDAGSRFPIFVNLRHYPGHLNIRALLINTLIGEHQCRCPNYAMLHQLLLNGGLMLFLDGFDEMATRTDPAITLRNFHEVSTLCVGQNKVVLTCRTHFFESSSEMNKVFGGTQNQYMAIAKSKNYKITYVEPFSIDDIEMYLKRSLGDKWNECYEVMKQTYDLLELAKRPILLDMITGVLPTVSAGGGRIRSADLYTRYVHLWLDRDDWRVQVKHGDRLKFTIAFAMRMYLANRSEFSATELRDAICAMWPKTSASDLDVYVNDIRTCSFIRHDGETYGFVHKSFLEFFIATHLYATIVQDDSDAMAACEYSSEVLRFCAEHQITIAVGRTLVAWSKKSQLPALKKNIQALLSLMGIPSGSELAGLVFDDKRFCAVVFDDVAFEDVAFRRCVVKGCSVNGSRSLRVKWENVSFDETNVVGSRFVESSFERVKWTDSKIAQTTWSNCNFKSCNIDLTRIDGEMGQCKVDGLVVRGGVWSLNLVGTVFSGVHFHAVDFRGSRFSGGRIGDSVIADCDLSGVRFKNLKVSGVVWSVSSLNGVVFEDVFFDDEFADWVAELKADAFRHLARKPVFLNVQGLPAKAIEHLREFGCFGV